MTHRTKKTKPKEVFIPTYELVLCERDNQGNITGRMKTYTAYNGHALAGCYYDHRKKNPIPRRKHDKRNDATK